MRKLIPIIIIAAVFAFVMYGDIGKKKNEDISATKTEEVSGDPDVIAEAMLQESIDEEAIAKEEIEDASLLDEDTEAIIDVGTSYEQADL